MNAPSWKECNSWEEIKFLCENSVFTVCGFVYDAIKMVISKHYHKITLNIGDYTNSSVSQIINNLPENIDALVINITPTSETKYLENTFTNLPFSLKKIKFVYKQSKLSEIKNTEDCGKFNTLFGVKIPFNCGFVVSYANVDYDVKYIDYENELELGANNQVFKIKYVKPKPPVQNGHFAGGGGLMQLAAYGAMDGFLTGNPQLTFFKVNYRQHSNFSMETINMETPRIANKIVKSDIAHNLQKIQKIQKRDKFLESNRYQKALFNKQNNKMKTNYR